MQRGQQQRMQRGHQWRRCGPRGSAAKKPAKVLEASSQCRSQPTQSKNLKSQESKKDEMYYQFEINEARKRRTWLQEFAIADVANKHKELLSLESREPTIERKDDSFIISITSNTPKASRSAIENASPPVAESAYQPSPYPTHPPPNHPPPGYPDQRVYKTGVRVKLHSLVKTGSMYNGKFGVLTEYRTEEQRWGVRLDQGREVSIKEGNLALAQALPKEPSKPQREPYEANMPLNPHTMTQWALHQEMMDVDKWSPSDTRREAGHTSTLTEAAPRKPGYIKIFPGLEQDASDPKRTFRGVNLDAVTPPSKTKLSFEDANWKPPPLTIPSNRTTPGLGVSALIKTASASEIRFSPLCINVESPVSMPKMVKTSSLGKRKRTEVNTKGGNRDIHSRTTKLLVKDVGGVATPVPSPMAIPADQYGSLQNTPSNSPPSSPKGGLGSLSGDADTPRTQMKRKFGTIQDKTTPRSIAKEDASPAFNGTWLDIGKALQRKNDIAAEMRRKFMTAKVDADVEYEIDKKEAMEDASPTPKTRSNGFLL